MDARNNSKKPTKSSKEKDKKSTNKPTTPMEESEITIHTSEEDMSIIAADKNEANQPILGDNQDNKPSSTSTPKRKAMEDQGTPKKKQIMEGNDGQNDDDKVIDAGEEEVKEIRMEEGGKIELQFSFEEKL